MEHEIPVDLVLFLFEMLGHNFSLPCKRAMLHFLDYPIARNTDVSAV